MLDFRVWGLTLTCFTEAGDPFSRMKLKRKVMRGWPSGMFLEEFGRSGKK